MTGKDWTGNAKSIYSAIGARNFAKEPREVNDYYATEPKAAEEHLGNHSPRELPRTSKA